jgi:hypothetical protein
MDEAGRAMVAQPAAPLAPAADAPAATQPKRADGKVGNVAAASN